MIAVLGVQAQSWWTPLDRHRYNDETVVYAALELNNWSASYSNQHYRLAAFIDDECRAVADAPVAGEDGSLVFVLRVTGDRSADKEKTIRFEVCCKDNDYGLVYDVAPATPVIFDGESWGRPSSPVVMQGKGYTGAAFFRFDEATIQVGETVDIVSLFQDSTIPKYESITLSDLTVASLQGTVVTGLQPGQVRFTVHFPGVSIGNVITVIQPATALNILNDEIRVDVEHPETLQPKAEASYELLPANTTDHVTWIIDDETVVSYDPTENRLNAAAVGQTYIEPVVLADDGSIRLRPADGKRIHVIVYENIPLQAFAVSIGHVAVGETTPMTLTPIPADATFDLLDFDIILRSSSLSLAAYKPVDIQLLSREPLIYNITGLLPGWVNIEIQPKNVENHEAYPVYAGGGSGELFSGFNVDERLAFSEGWQWRTNPYGTLDASNLETIFGPSLVEARTQQELLYNDPELGYFGTIMTGEGIPENTAYKVKMQRDAVSYIVSGSNASSWSIELDEGWTWIPSIYFYDRLLTTAFDGNDLPEGTVIVSKDQGSAEWDGNQWEGDLQVLPTRQSFLCYYPSESTGILNYAPEAMMAQGHETPDVGTTDPLPAAAQTAPVNSSLFTLHSSLQTTARRFRDNMTMVATLNSPSTIHLPPSSFLLAYVGDELRGVGRQINGRYHLTIHADGGERVSLRLQDADGREWPVDEQFTVSQLRLGSLRQPMALHSQALLQGIDDAQLSSPSVQHATYYDLQGRRVLHPQKNHIYIINHKKVKL